MACGRPEQHALQVLQATFSDAGMGQAQECTKGTARGASPRSCTALLTYTLTHAHNAHDSSTHPGCNR